MALNLTVIGLSWLLAACSAVLWLRKYPGRPIGRGHPETRRGRPLDVLGLAGIPLVAWAGSNLQERYHWGWWVIPVVYVPLFAIGVAAPILTRRWQLRRSTTPTSSLDSSPPTPPVA